MIEVADLLPNRCWVGCRSLSREQILDLRPLMQGDVWQTIRERMAHVALLEIQHKVDFNHDDCCAWLSLYLMNGLPADLERAVDIIALTCAPIPVTANLMEHNHER